MILEICELGGRFVMVRCEVLCALAVGDADVDLLCAGGRGFAVLIERKIVRYLFVCLFVSESQVDEG